MYFTEVGSVVYLMFAESVCRLWNLTTGLSLSGILTKDARQAEYLRIHETHLRDHGGFGT